MASQGIGVNETALQTGVRLGWEQLSEKAEPHFGQDLERPVLSAAWLTSLRTNYSLAELRRATDREGREDLGEA